MQLTEQNTNTLMKQKKKVDRSTVIKLGLKLRKWVNGYISRRSLVGNPPIFKDAHDQFPWIHELESNWPTIRDEGLAIFAYKDAIPSLRQISKEHGKIAVDNTWKSFFLWGHGVRSDFNCARAPKTTELVERIPGLNTALFSIHEPGLHIPRHKGLSKAMLVCHLGLQVPKDRANCRMEVDKKHTLHWDEGKTFVFDDLYDHEVWNDTDQSRIILPVQFERPVTWPARIAGRAFMVLARLSPFIRKTKRNMKEWEERFAALEAATSDQSANPGMK